MTPLNFYMSVGYDWHIDDQAATLASYRGVRLETHYRGREADVHTFSTGDFYADYNAAVAYVRSTTPDPDVPFYASSSVDDFPHDAGLE